MTSYEALRTLLSEIVKLRADAATQTTELCAELASIRSDAASQTAQLWNELEALKKEIIVLQKIVTPTKTTTTGTK